jgi:hypothetical protein
LNLAIISKEASKSNNQLITQLKAWKSENPNHPANSLIPDDGTLNSIQAKQPPRKIAILLPLKGPLMSSGPVVREGFLNAYYENRSGQEISFYDSSVNDIGAVYQKALAEGADTIVGPLTKESVQTLLHSSSFPVPTIALNYTDNWGSLPANFYEFGLSPNDEAQQMAGKAIESGHKRAIVIAPNTDWGRRVSKTAIEQWSTTGGTIADTFYFNSKTDLNNGIAQLLHANAKVNKRRQDFDVIFLLASPESARQIVPLLKYYYASNVPIYSTSVIYAGKPEPEKDSDLNGIKFAETPWSLKLAKSAGKITGSRSNRLYAVGRDAYLLTNQIYRLTFLPNFPIYGATGSLSLNSSHQVYRRLPWTQMHDGRP